MTSTSVRKSRMAVVAVAALAPIVAFYAIAFREMRNSPIIDDYQTFLGFLLSLSQHAGTGSKLLWIFAAQNLEYKFPLLNAITATLWAVTGKIDFRWVIVPGNLLVLGILWLLWQSYFTAERDRMRRVILFLPVCFIFMQLNYGEALDWATANMDYVPAIFFSFAALHFLLQPARSSFWFACLFALLGYFCFPNAFLVFPLGCIILVRARNWKAFAAWLGTLLLAIAAFLFRYHSYPPNTTGTPLSLGGKLLFYCSLAGGAVENMSGYPIRHAAIVMGIILLSLIVLSLRSRFYRTNPFAFYSMLWLLMTCALIAQWRSAFAFNMSLVGRYKLYSDLLLVYAYAFLVHRFDTPATPAPTKRWLYAAVLTASIVFAAGSDFFGYRFLAHRQRMVALGLNEYTADPSKNVPLISFNDAPLPAADPMPERDRIILNQTIAAGMYQLPPPAKR